jgi:uncharacterized protein YceK
MCKRIIIYLLVFSTLISSGCAKVLRHDPSMAAVEAQKFADTAFVQHDPQKAYDLLAVETKKTVSSNEFMIAIVKMHPTGYPSKVSAAEYEPIPGQPAMNIYLRGQSEKENFYYRLVMKGTGGEGYKVGGLWRSDDPPPESSVRRPLTESPAK